MGFKAKRVEETFNHKVDAPAAGHSVWVVS